MGNYRFIIRRGPVKVEFTDVSNAIHFCTAPPEVNAEGEVKGDRVIFKVRLPDNILNHILVISELNYTSGFPFELAKGLSLRTRLELNSSKLKYGCWALNASILESEANTIEDLLNLLHEMEIFLHEGTKPNKLKTEFLRSVFEEFKAYDESLSWSEFLEGIGKSLGKKEFQILRKAIMECYSSFYKKYWRKRRVELEELSRRMKKVVDILQPLKTLEETIGLKFDKEYLEVYPIDVYRIGGGIYGAISRITCGSDPSIVLTIHVDIAHEAGHIIIGNWKIEYANNIRELANSINFRIPSITPYSYIPSPLMLANTIEEHIVAFIQLKVDMKYTRRRRKTHGYMDNPLFKIVEKTWEETEKAYAKFNFKDFIERLLEKVSKSDEAKRTLMTLLRLC